ncbi:LytR family transcriptional regulator [Microbacterium ulmi]|uniref:LytR family transcriptional regulator n=1 Tax=Microbacterium ulmi TaxID=179095 RepID=A0A7Y2Q1S4_9MICO|nr:LytR family transcriptional regulator [Microbacterium ulmi]
MARHGRLRTPSVVARLVAMLAVALGVGVVSSAGVAAFAVWDAASAVTENAIVLDEDVQLPPSLGAIEGGVNILLVGTDSCEGQDVALFPRCANDDSPGERNDVTMLVHISDEPRRVTVVSFPRDMLVPIPACEKPDGSGTLPAMRSQMINSSYFYGGLGCTVDTVEALTGETIHAAAAIRWTGVIHLSDAIGGVDVCVTGDISDKHTGLHLTEGTHTLQGVEALQFLRIRHGIGDGSDLGRISNQQQFMSSLVRKLQSDSVLANPGVLFSLATTTLSQVSQGQLVVSSALTNPAFMVQVAMALKDVAYEDIVFVQYPTYYRPGDGRSDVMPVTSAADVLFQALRDNRPLSLTGEASQGYGVEVEGEAAKPAPAASADPSAPAEGGSPAGSAPAEGGSPAGDAAASAPPPTEAPAAVELPSTIAGTTAAQVTCTVPQR